ncbi:MAG TPA: prepilin peptidase [Accumulibacter sp.]|nr:prepilin peptidase [Accumulibacter sp.]HMX22691.1 prepilin peptidase [Accumulibacter sp.]HNE12260.1 prepilin peptidase [Accumulibacter sp.]HNG39860.1 prepilin peptidase [Accumulibacter sp.]HNK00071.1 prepilin peptidase [Accumulibacter sp.]
MKAAALPCPGLLWGAYPERRRLKPRTPVLTGRLQVAVDQPRRIWEELGQRRLLTAVRAAEQAIGDFDDDAFDAESRRLRLLVRHEGLNGSPLAQTLALVSEACRRELGWRLYDSQLIAAGIVLDNRLAEMATGEGKTLAIGAAAATAALSGMPVHVITANDYLVVRDLDTLRPLYRRLGLTAGAITQEVEPDDRRIVYANDITYCTAKELVFDYLRDSISRTRGQLRWHLEQLCGASRAKPLLRGLCLAIVDEADSILIDEARVPLILAQATGNPQEQEFLARTLALADGLRAGVDFAFDRGTNHIELTAAGRERLERTADAPGPAWRNRLHREETVRMALAARHLYHRDRHYLVRDEKVQIIDETTGRTAAGRIWSRGLHQLIEIKEGCPPSAPQTTAAQITYQRFFPRYLRLGGLSGTLDESRRELLAVYGLPVRRVPLRRPDQRRILPNRLFADRESLWRAVGERCAERQRAGQPVLIGTESVADSDALSAYLTASGLDHVVLNARDDCQEAQIVAQAGQPGRITVTTNMAGRGTDIRLAEGVIEHGGLHVINCQLNAARRIDRQLAGRCARQGDPGSVETWLSLDNALFRRHFPGWLLERLHAQIPRLNSWLIRQIAGGAQHWEEAHHTLQRHRLLEHDKTFERRLSFAGRAE